LASESIIVEGLKSGEIIHQHLWRKVQGCH